MKAKKISLLLVSFIILLSGCVKQVNLDLRIAKPILVVEGEITNDSLPYSVKLTYSGPYKSGLEIPDEFLEKQAKVTIQDDQGNMTNMVYRDKGVYETDDKNYVGKTGRSYSIIVELKDGRKYISTPEKMKDTVPLSNIRVQYVWDKTFISPTSMHVFINAKDPGEEGNYYKWNFYSFILRQTHGVPCGTFCLEFEYCFQKVADKEVRIFSDASINGNEIKNQMVGKAYIYTFGNAYIDIAQRSLTREAYQYWQKYNDQVERTGHILDPLPASIKGNVYNAADPNDFALGYFSASSVVHKRAVLIPFSITQYLLDLTAIEFIPEGSHSCFDYFPNTLPYPHSPARQWPPPPGWENAEQIEVRW